MDEYIPLETNERSSDSQLPLNKQLDLTNNLSNLIPF